MCDRVMLYDVYNDHKGCFPLDGILCAEWNFSLFVSFEAEKIPVRRAKLRLVENDLKWHS